MLIAAICLFLHAYLIYIEEKMEKKWEKKLSIHWNLKLMKYEAL